MRKRLLLVGLFLMISLRAAAQNSLFSEYLWTGGNLALIYPAHWESPFETEIDGQRTLYLAQGFASTPENRPPGIPFITLRIFPASTDPDTPIDPAALLETALAAENIAPLNQLPTDLLGTDALSMWGESAEGLLFGLGRAGKLSDGRFLLIWGRAPVELQMPYERLFESVISSITPGIANRPTWPQYGPLWQRNWYPTDGERGLFFLTHIAEAENTLYLLDGAAGIIWLDAVHGMELKRRGFDGTVQPAALALDANGRILVSDLLCGCILRLENDIWATIAEGFAPGAPLSIAVTADGSIYATDFRDETVVVRRIAPDGEKTLTFAAALPEQPTLMMHPDGRLFALSLDGVLYGEENGAFIAIFQAEGVLSGAAAVDNEGNIALGTLDRGIVIYDRSGAEIERVGRAAAGPPKPGELLQPRALIYDVNQTLYWIDGDGSFGSVTAASRDVAPGRVGRLDLLPDSIVRGTLDENTSRHIWTFSAVEDLPLTLTAAADPDSFALDLALRVVAPTGNEAAFNDQHESLLLFAPLDAQIADYSAPESGRYAVIVERVSGSGGYRLGLTQNRSFELAEAGNASLSGELSDVIPMQRWVFNARAGQRLSITALADAFSLLDPTLRIVNPQGNIVAENDDAADLTLGRSAQILDFRVSFNGAYTIEVARLAGEGAYTLLIEQSP